MRENLAVMRAEAAGALASTLEVTELVDRIDRGAASDDDVTWHRILVNANKFSTSLAATRVVRRAIEALGGNGTIEDFSPLPRLYRDAIVFESWEGTHNVLCAQVLRDLAGSTRSSSWSSGPGPRRSRRACGAPWTSPRSARSTYAASSRRSCARSRSPD